ncbi:MAG: Cyclohex-1-ene-1-carbonyl-CoA dehydrogenase [Pseudomonadales bacterium]|nr:Cyclohex-1-ene-1-carbonyl-CoA dehydrogenase [Pseudomonadales bacterium]
MEFDLDIGLSDEMRAVRETCRRFATEVLRPTGIKLDRLSAQAVIAADSPLWDVLKQFRALGFAGGAMIDDPSLSPAERALTHCIIVEELCTGDVGLFITCGLLNIAPTIAQAAGRADLVEFFGARDEICCLALTEPGRGSDIVAFTEPGYRDPRVKPVLKCRREGDVYVLNGQKSSWVSTGTIAGSGSVYATFENSPVGLADGAVFLMPFDLPGITKGKPLEKIGQRTLNQGEIFFDNVEVPAKFLIAEGPEIYPLVWEMTLKGANIAMGEQFVGVARAAYELALDYAKQWVQGGGPIIQHQNVKNRLFSMFQKVETARALARRVAIADATQAGGVPFQYAAASKVYATQAAFEVAHDAIQTLGGNGLTHEYLAEKLFRDARSSLIEDGENSMLGLMAASRL